MQSLPISILPAKNSRLSEVDFNHLEFGAIASDHKFISEFSGDSWGNARIEPFGNLSVSPFISGLHYGQTVFEGLKAFKRNDGKACLFRADAHALRFNRSLERMCMPAVPPEFFTEALEKLIHTDQAWIPDNTKGSLYIRPFMFASESRLGVKISSEYIFMIVCSPVGPYYEKFLQVKVERDYARSFPGGTGFAKCGGNYGGAFYPSRLAKEQGYDQVIWTDARNHEYLEESGTMNIGFILGDCLITPRIEDTLLSGITRDSILALAQSMGLAVEQRPVHYKELLDWKEKGLRVEAFGMGTAAVVAPIKAIDVEGQTLNTFCGQEAVMFRLKKELSDIRSGGRADVWGWIRQID